jgi:hypothetical protein
VGRFASGASLAGSGPSFKTLDYITTTRNIDVSLDIVVLKLNEAKFHLRHMGNLRAMHEFYAAANAFVTAVRSVLYVAQHQFGWKERPRSATYTQGQEIERKAFDAWFMAAHSVQAVLTHPLADDRHQVIHRSGQAGFVHVPKPGMGGMAVSHGTPFKQSHWFTRRGIGGLPPQDDNAFYYLESNGTKVDAIAFAQGFLSLVEAFFTELRRRPWA